MVMVLIVTYGHLGLESESGTQDGKLEVIFRNCLAFVNKVLIFNLLMDCFYVQDFRLTDANFQIQNQTCHCFLLQFIWIKILNM